MLLLDERNDGGGWGEHDCGHALPETTLTSDPAPDEASVSVREIELAVDAFVCHSTSTSPKVGRGM